MKRKLKNSLKGKLLMFVMASFLIVAIVVAIVGVFTFSNSMTDQVQDEMKHIISLVEKRYDEKYPGAFDIKLLEDGSYEVYKGKQNITTDYAIIDQIKESFGYEVTLFCKNIRVQTTMEDNVGKRLLTTRAATLVVADVIDNKTEAFYKDVSIGEKKQFAYYKPILLEDGTVYGMIGVCRSADTVKHAVWLAVLPLVSVCIGMSILFCLLSIRYISGVIVRIESLQKFTNAVARGNFNMELPATVLKSDDELGDLAKDGKKMQQAIRLLVEYDALTQLHNRRYGDRRLKQVMSKAKQSGLDFCVGITDIDFFKKVNDTYGHDAGDEVLKGVARIMKKHMTGQGFVARWGGEEFLIVFEHQKVDAAVEALEAMFDEIRAMRIDYQGQVIQVTMSMGIVQGTTDGKEDELLKQADDLLYYAKENGRNQIQR